MTVAQIRPDRAAPAESTDAVAPTNAAADLGAEPSTTMDRLTELVNAAGTDRRARRQILDRTARALVKDAEAERRARATLIAAEQRAQSAQAQAEARVLAAQAEMRVRESEREAERTLRAARRDDAAAERQARAERWTAHRARMAQWRDNASSAAPAILSMVVYSTAVASAIYGQVSVATTRFEVPLIFAVAFAAFVELTALSMALTANRLRLRRERARAPRILTWVAAVFAAGVNIWGHAANPLMAAFLGGASLGGITLWEIRSSARHRQALRDAKQLAEPMPTFGIRFWALNLPVAFTAYRLAVRSRVAPDALPLVQQAEMQRTVQPRGGRRLQLWLAIPIAIAGGAATSAGLEAAEAGQRMTWLVLGLCGMVLAPAMQKFAVRVPATGAATAVEPSAPMDVPLPHGTDGHSTPATKTTSETAGHRTTGEDDADAPDLPATGTDEVRAGDPPPAPRRQLSRGGGADERGIDPRLPEVRDILDDHRDKDVAVIDGVIAGRFGVSTRTARRLRAAADKVVPDSPAAVVGPVGTSDGESEVGTEDPVEASVA